MAALAEDNVQLCCPGLVSISVLEAIGFVFPPLSFPTSEPTGPEKAG